MAPGEPADDTLPFFAYGIFRRGEIAYPLIEAFVERVDRAVVRGKLLERDGFPLLVLDEGGSVEGDLVHFSAGAEAEAFRTIDELESRLYRWARAEIRTSGGRLQAMALVARSPGRGTHPYEGFRYRSRDDPFFREGMEQVLAVAAVESAEELTRTEKFFRAQAAYSLLWSAIERYCTLRYGVRAGVLERIRPLAEEDAFRSALRRHVPDRREGTEVVRSDHVGQSEVLDPADPARSLRFYYQVRSNIVHRGKSQLNELRLVRDSLSELHAIFTDVLDATLGDPDSHERTLS